MTHEDLTEKENSFITMHRYVSQEITQQQG